MKTFQKIKTGALLTGAGLVGSLSDSLRAEQYVVDFGEGPIAKITHDGNTVKHTYTDSIGTTDLEYLFDGNILVGVVEKADTRYWVNITNKMMNSKLKEAIKNGADLVEQKDKIVALGWTAQDNGKCYIYRANKAHIGSFINETENKLRTGRDTYFNLDDPKERGRPEVWKAINEMKEAMREIRSPYFSWVNVNDPAIVLGLKTWSDKLTAGENIKKKEIEKQYVGVQFRNKTPKKKISEQSIVPAEAVLTSTHKPKTK
jgi:hypothetical protein